MRRIGKEDEFRSNVHRGGRTELVELDDDAKTLAVRAAHIMGLRVAGVDLLEGDDGPLVMEVNSSPGLEGIENATGLDIAGAIIDYMSRQVRLPRARYPPASGRQHRLRRCRTGGRGVCRSGRHQHRGRASPSATSRF